jgi:hypothetical protein
MTRRPPALLLLLLLVLLAACGGGSGVKVAPTRTPSAVGSPRGYLMGFSSLPYAQGDEAYRASFKFLGDSGEVAMIQRAPPWTDFLPGAVISERTENLTRLERDLAKANNLKLFLAVDATDPADRGQLNGLPDDLKGKDFSDPRIRSAFIAYAQYLALNYKPAYLALGVEVDLFYGRRGDGPFRNFQSVYFEAYDAVKRASPNTLVFPTFQYEDMIGVVSATGQRTQPVWSLVSRFDPKIDMLAVSSFPSFLVNSPDDLPADYYSQMKGRLNKPMAFVSIGWPTNGDQPGEAAQLAFLRRALSATEDLKLSMLIWYLARDPATPVNPSPSFAPLSTTGLFAAEGRPKAAWQLWRLFLDRTPPR